MSPEQAMAQEVGPPSDVFSLGCVLAFAATGHSPFGAGPAHAVVYRVVHADPDLHAVPTPLTDLVAACLAKDPAARPSLQHVLDRLAAPAAPGQGQWLPEALTQVITERQTMALTALHDPATTGSGGPQTMAPPSAQPGQPRAPQPLLVNERRRRRGSEPRWPASTVYGLLALFALISVSTVVHQFHVFNNAGRYVDESDFVDLLDAYEWVATIMWVAQIVSGLGLAGAWLLWFHRVRVVAERRAPGRLRYGPSMAVYGWLIPIGNLLLPKQIAYDVWQASSPPGRDGTTAPAGLLHAWWIFCLVTFLTWPLFWIKWTTLLGIDSVHLRYEFTWRTWASVAVHMLVVPTAIVTALFVRRLGAMQAARLDS
jgi:eukaryotic-like serine/threonine-protein kinase